MKKIPEILSLAFAIIATIGLGAYIGYLTEHMALGIIVGFILGMMYLFYNVVKK